MGQSKWFTAGQPTTRLLALKPDLERMYFVDGLGQVAISKIIGVHQRHICHWFKVLGISSRPKQGVKKIGLPPKNLTGLRFGSLAVLSFSHRDARGRAIWHARCDCGQECEMRGDHLQTQNSTACKSCGAQKTGQAHVTHGATGTREYINFIASLHRRGLRQRTPAWADLDAIRIIYQKCPSGSHVDHIIPLRGKLVSGLHVPQNLQYLPGSENCRKSNKFTPIQESYGPRNTN